MILGYDSHCHLQDPAFDVDRQDVYAKAHALGLGMIIPGYSRASSEQAVNLANGWDHAYALVGVHPHDARDFTSEDEGLMRSWSREPKVVGIGEIGLDYHYDLSPRRRQREVLLAQLLLARELSLPVSIHSREAEEDTLELIDGVKGIRGVLHCFTGSLAFAQALLSREFYLSFSGVVTFASAKALREVVGVVPLERMLIETDSPYLAPVPYRGRRNQPDWVFSVAELVAKEKSCSEKEVFSKTMANTIALFSVKA